MTGRRGGDSPVRIWRRAREFAKLALEVRLIAVARLEGDLHQGQRGVAGDKLQRPPEAQYAAESFRRKADGVAEQQAPAA
jgi:hypothetical protein